MFPEGIHAMAQGILNEPHFNNGSSSKIATAHTRRSVLAPHYEALFRWLQGYENGTSNPPKTVGITSCQYGEGVSTVVANLGVVAARAGIGRVLLVDANVARSSLHRLFHVPPSPGWLNVLADTSSAREYPLASPIDRLSLLPAGTLGEEDVPQYTPTAIKAALDELRWDYELVLVDLPPANESSTCFAIAGKLDGVLLLLEAERVHCESARRVKRQLMEADATMLGVILNKQRGHIGR